MGRQLARARGALREIHWAMGPYDIVAASEASDDETASAFALALAAQGTVRMSTTCAFSTTRRAASSQGL